MTEGYVLDASAILACLRDERGKERVELCLEQSIISAVNVSEVAAKLCEYGMTRDQVAISLTSFVDLSIPFDTDQALAAGALRGATRAKGLSLGDRACLTLAQSTNRVAVTADRAWAELDIGVAIEVIR